MDKNKITFSCALCGSIPEIVETYDTLQIVCRCDRKGKEYFGDYYDEGFMFTEYGDIAIRDWNIKNTLCEVLISLGDYCVIQSLKKKGLI